MTEAKLLADVLADPDADTPRLVYADWLEEHGREDHAAFIRVMVERDRLPEPEYLTGTAPPNRTVRSQRTDSAHEKPRQR